MKKVTFFALLCLIQVTAFSQLVEAGLMGGAMFYKGDLTPGLYSPLHPAGGMLIRFNVHERVSLKGNVLIGSVSGADNVPENQNNPDRLRRNLSFHSSIIEFAAEVELNLIKEFNSKGERRICVPYVFAGLETFHFNPKADLTDSISGVTTTYELQPLGTEGQGLTKYPGLKRYNLTAFGFPMGLGVKVHMGKYWSLGAEMGMRKTLTDYLDDVSGFYVERDLISAQYGPVAGRLADRTYEVLPGVENPKGNIRGNPTNQDWYGFTGIWVSYTFYKKSKYRCSTF